MSIQNLETVNPGRRCKVRVMNNSGDDVLTTFDNADVATCVEASETIEDFWSRCIDEHKTPTIFGKAVGGGGFDLLRVDEGCKPNFDLGLFEEILIQPAPLVGG